MSIIPRLLAMALFGRRPRPEGHRRHSPALMLALSALLVTGGALLPGGDARAQEKVLTLVSSFPMDGPAGDKMYVVKLFIERFNEKAAGKARIRVVGGPEVVSPFDQLKALQTGQFDMMVSTSLYFRDLREAQFFHFIPFEQQIRTAPQTYELMQRITRDQADVVFLQFSSPGLGFYLWTKDRPVSAPADANGQKIRTFGDTTDPLVRHLGVVPTSIPSNEVYSALRTGLLDGALRDILSIEVLNEGEYLKYRTEAGVADIETETYISARSWDSLTDEVRQIFNDVARETEVEGFAWMQERTERTLNSLQDSHGVEVVPSSPELKTILGETIPSEIIRGIVSESEYRDEIIEKFELQSYFD